MKDLRAWGEVLSEMRAIQCLEVALKIIRTRNRFKEYFDADVKRMTEYD